MLRMIALLFVLLTRDINVCAFTCILVASEAFLVHINIIRRFRYPNWVEVSMVVAAVLFFKLPSVLVSSYILLYISKERGGIVC